MPATFHRYAIISLLCIFSLPIYAENLTPVSVSADQSTFLQNLNASVTAPIGSTQVSNTTSSASAPIEAVSSQTTNNTLTTGTAATKVQQLKATQAQLQSVLNTMQAQTKQIQANLNAVKQELEKARAMQGPSNETPENKQQTLQLLSEYQKMQTSLMDMFQQQTQLQSDMTISNQQLIQLQQAIEKSNSPAPMVPSSTTSTTPAPSVPVLTKTQTTTSPSPVSSNISAVTQKSTTNVDASTSDVSNTQENRTTPIATPTSSTPIKTVSTIPAPTQSINIDDIKKPVNPVSVSSTVTLNIPEKPTTDAPASVAIKTGLNKTDNTLTIAPVSSSAKPTSASLSSNSNDDITQPIIPKSTSTATSAPNVTSNLTAMTPASVPTEPEPEPKANPEPNKDAKSLTIVTMPTQESTTNVAAIRTDAIKQPEKNNTLPTPTPKKSSNLNSTAAQPISMSQKTDFNKHLEKGTMTPLMAWIKDPVIMLRTGLIFIGLALLFILIFFWPKSNQSKLSDPIATLSKPKPKTDIDTSTQIHEDEELTSDYDFMNTEEAIPARLDLARAYIEMNKYEEAKEAIAPVFEQGNDQQKSEAKQLLDMIDKKTGAEIL